MAQPRRLLWDPLGSNRFILSGNSEVRLYEWTTEEGASRFETLAVSSELGQLRCFDWARDGSSLVGCGLTTGRTTLLQLDLDGAGHRTSHSINVRHARPVNAVSFAPPSRSGILAVGLDKGRGESLLVFDVERSAASTRTSSLGGSIVEPHPLHQFGSSESVSSAAWLSNSLLLAGMSSKWLRVFDLRGPGAGQTALTWGSRATSEIAPNPFEPNQFASHGDDGVVRLFDLRRPMEHLLAFSEADAGAGVTRARTPALAKPLAQIAFSPTRRGVLTTLGKDDSSLRVWHIAEGMSAKVEQVEHAFDWQQRREEQDPLKLPVVLSDERPEPFQQALSSFAFALPADSSSSPSADTHLLGVSRDTNPGSSGHRLEVVTLRHHQPTSLTELGLVLSDCATSLGLRTWSTPVAQPPVVEDLHVEEGEAHVLNSGSEDESEAIDRGRTRSFAAGMAAIDRNETPRPAGSVTPRRLSKMRTTEEAPLRTEQLTKAGGLAALKNDVSLQIRRRVEEGYGPDAGLNATIADAALGAFWEWIARAERLLPVSCLLDYDFRYRGVLSILTGFPTTSAAASAHGSSFSAQSPSLNGGSGGAKSHVADVRRSIRKGDETRARNAALADFATAATALASSRKLDELFCVSSTNIASQRKLALACCGPDWSEPWEVVCVRFLRQGRFDEAARHAFLTGHLESTIEYLKRSKNDRMRLLAPIVAAFVGQRNNGGGPSQFGDLCAALKRDADDAWVAALFDFMSGSEWEEIITESSLPLRDLVGVSLTHFSDRALLATLNRLGDENLKYGNLEAVVLFGLRGDGLTLLRNYLDREADLQTVALAASFVQPAILRHDARAERWIESYRTTLDRLELFAPRAMLDCARGRRARQAMEAARVAGRRKEVGEIGDVLRGAAPAQIRVKCQFCSSVISHADSALGNPDKAALASATSTKATLCPNCSKSLPGCSICLQKPSIHTFSADGSSSLAWCQRCRHGGHVKHLLEWFDRSPVCAVADCSCRCNEEQ